MSNFEFLAEHVLGNSVQEWLVATLVFLVLFVGVRLVLSVALSRIKGLTAQTTTNMDDTLVGVFSSIGTLFYFTIALYVAVRGLTLPAIVHTLTYAAMMIAVVWEAIGMLERVVLFFVEKVWLKEDSSSQREHVMYVLGLAIRVVLWATGIVLILSNLGFEVSSLVASLGIGGVAIALAVQNILGDIFSSFSIYFDQPFKVGDFIIVGDHMGTVQRIGLKTTRMQALQGEEIVISNAELTSARVRNFKQMKKRRIVFPFGVTYDTSKENLKKLPSIVQNVIDPIEHAEFDRAHLKDFGDSSLNYEVVYYVLTGDYKEYMDIQQAINLGLYEHCAQEGIEFAFPTRTVHVVNS